jgi:hypothetical protein
LARELLLRLFEESIRWEGRILKNFDQWTEALSRQVVLQSDEQDTKTVGKADEFLSEDDFEEEE